MSSAPTDSPRLDSKLPTARERFLARVVDHAFDEGWRTAEDFLRHFPPRIIVESLASADELRVKLLVEATGARERLALKKSIASAAEDLDLALQEELTDPDAVLGLYPPDDKVRHLPADALWSFYVEDGFYNTDRSTDAARHGRAVERLTFALEVALDEKLLALRDIADGITFDEIAERLPVEDVRQVLKHALQIARSDRSLVEEELHEVVPLGALVGHVPLAHTWERVIIDKVAAPAGFCERVSSVPPRAVGEASKPAAKKDASAASKQTGEPPAEPALAEPALAEPALEDEVPLPPPPLPPAAAAKGPDEDVDALLDGLEAAPPPLPQEPAVDEAAPSPEEDAARRRVMDRLVAIERLPPSSDDLPTPLLLSIDSMYADLASATHDDEREAIVEEAFPNESHLRTAMLALIGLLDATVDVVDPVIRDADPKNLIKIVLFEERRRAEPRRSSPGGVAPGPASRAGGNGRHRSAPPPPVPRTSSAPPPPRQSARRSK